MSFYLLSALRTILDTETDNDSPGGEEVMSQLRENLESFLMLAFDTGESGSATSDPPDDTTGILTDSGAAYDADAYNGFLLLITSGIAKGFIYLLDDTTATTLVCTGDNLYNDGIRSGDTYKIFYNFRDNTDGHDHDGINSKISATYNIDTGTYTGDGTTGQSISGVGFLPRGVWIFKNATGDAVTDGPWVKIDRSWGDFCYYFLSTSGSQIHIADNRINSFDSDGFTVDDDGTNADPNANGVTYHYLAIG